MKKNILALVICFCLMAASATAYAGTSGIYIAPRTALLFMSKGDSSFGNTDSNGIPDEFGNGSGLSLGASIGLGVGYDFQYAQSYLPVRIEGEIMFRMKTDERVSFTAGQNYEFEQGIASDTYMVHAYYDFYNSTPFAPYISLGAGLARVTTNLKVDSVIFEEVENHFALAGGVGVSWQTQFGFNVDLGYRYTYITESDIKINSLGKNLFSKATPSTHEVMAGIRYVF